MPVMDYNLLPKFLLTALLLSSSACSILPEDMRASLPESMRGDTRALTDYPTPDLSGQWSDADYPELAITLQQNETSYSFTRKGTLGGIAINETHNGKMNGRSAASTYLARDGGIRPVKGRCFGTVDKGSTNMVLTCEDSKKGTYPMNLRKL